MILTPTSKLSVNYNVDTKFTCLRKHEDGKDPISVKSKLRFLILLMGCPLSWESKLKTQIASSTKQAEFLALK
jgi:hypothetical protein